MKHVPRLTAEPPSLAAYRAENPADAGADGSIAKKVWERFRDDPAYKELQELLLKRQQGLCGYCEQRLATETGKLIINDQQVEHVLPKSGGQARTLDWRNLMLCCAGGAEKSHVDVSRGYRGRENVSCGQWKGDGSLGAKCDPRDFPLAPRLLNIGLDGRIRADITECYKIGINPTTLDHTINAVLNLNCERLRIAREHVVGNLLDVQMWLLQEQLAGSHLTEEQISKYREFFVAGRLQPDAHGYLRAFWTTERQYVEDLCSGWIEQNQALFL